MCGYEWLAGLLNRNFSLFDAELGILLGIRCPNVVRRLKAHWMKILAFYGNFAKKFCVLVLTGGEFQ